MNLSRIIFSLILLFALAIYNKEYKWISVTEAAETTSLLIEAKTDKITLDSIALNPVKLPVTVSFTSNQPVTIYYTTNGTVPTTSTTSHVKIETANGTKTGPTINSYDYMLMAIGEDESGSSTPLITYIFDTP